MGLTAPFASVIVPVFNSEKYLKRCLDSLINQTEKNIEIIAVDDGSTDRSDVILNEYKSHYSNILMLTTEKHSMAGGARNKGLEAAQGRYIAFVDSDDWIDTGFIKAITTALESSDADIGVCNVKREYHSVLNSKYRYKYNEKNTITGSFALSLLSRSLEQDISISSIVTNKIFKSSFIAEKQLFFLENSVNEDDVFTFKAISRASLISIVDNVSYHHFQRANSTSQNFSEKHITDLIDAFVEIRRDLDHQFMFESKKEDYFYFFEKCLKFLLETMRQSSISEEEVQKNILTLLLNLERISNLKEIISHIGYSRIMNFI